MHERPSEGRVVEIAPRGIALAALGLACAALAVLAGTGRLPLPTVPEVDAGASLWLVFLTGLSVGGLSCLAVQGGLLAALIAQREKRLHAGVVSSRRDHLRPVLAFLSAKVVAYGVLGALLGLFGSRIPLAAQAWVMVGAGLFMLAVALQLYDLHPALRRLSFAPPKAVQRLVRRQTRRDDVLAPIALGAMTVFIPCGVTLAMEFLAVASHDPARGAAIMLAFTAGTMPLFLAFGLAATQLGRSAWRVFRPLAFVTVLVIALTSIVSGARLLGIGTFGARTAGAPPVVAPMAEPSGAPASTLAQELTIDVASGGYRPERLRVRAGVPVRLRLVTNNTQGCIRAFVIPSLGVERMLPATGTETVDLPPQPVGRIDFMCSMGMFTGSIEVGGET